MENGIGAGSGENGTSPWENGTSPLENGTSPLDIPRYFVVLGMVVGSGSLEPGWSSSV